MLTLWGRSNSSNVMKVVWLLDELGLPYERRDAGLHHGVVDTAEYRRMNPFALVPVLQDGTVTLFESNTVLRYLCNVHAPGHALYPTAPTERAHVEKWMDAQLSALQAPMGMVFQQLIREPVDRRDDVVLNAALQRASRVWAAVEDGLGMREWLAGSAMTLADIAVGPILHRWFTMPIVRADTPALRALYNRLLARPAYATHCAGALT